MDLCGMPQKTPKEKRERQPNWTEAEKQMLLSLTRMHQVILENKGSDTATIKRKSDAWDEISANMKAAGYDRTKERLKQQLGRLRAAEVKKVKDALTKELAAAAIVNGISGSADASDESLPLGVAVQHTEKVLQTPGNQDTMMPLPLPPEIQIKIEKATTLKEFPEPPLPLPLLAKRDEDEEEQQCVMTPALEPTKRELFKEVVAPPMQTDADGGGNDDEDDDEEVIGESPTTSSAAAFKCSRLYRSDSLNAGVNTATSTTTQSSRRKLRIDGRVPHSRALRIRQLHLYRIAVERERLKTLRLQQKRDRVLYRKDMQIQNLKLQILRNLANQNRSNHINL